MSRRPPIFQHVILISGLLLIGINLRPAITAVGPLAERLRLDGLSVGMIGALTTVPLILFAVVGFFTGWIGRKLGFARTLGAGILVAAAGCFVRSIPGPEIWLVLGTVLIGAGIAVGNVLLPGIVKSRFPNHVGLLTSLYSTAMNLGAAFGIAFAVPMADKLSGGWRWSLGFWGIFAVVSLIFWMPQMLKRPEQRSTGNLFGPVLALAREKIARYVTLHMGVQSMVFYSIIAWLPTVLQWRGMEEAGAAYWVAGMQIIGCVASLIVPTLAGRAKSQGGWCAASALCSAFGLTGILFLNGPWIGASVLLLGVGLNASFGLSLLLIAMRSENAETAAGLSSLAQAAGYLFAAPGPWLVGSLFAVFSSWIPAVGLIIFLVVCVAVFGFLAGRSGTVTQ